MISRSDGPHSGIRYSHMRFKAGDISAWVPNDWEAEARAVLFATMRDKASPFEAMPTFNTGVLNPFFGISSHDVRTLARVNPSAAPWRCEDVTVNGTLCGLVGDRGQRVIPTLVLKCAQPMIHLAFVAWLRSLKDWTFVLEVGARRLRGEISTKGTVEFPFDVAVPDDDDSRLVANAFGSDTRRPLGLLALPTDFEFFDSLQDGIPIGSGIHVPSRCISYECGSMKRVVPLASSEAGQLVAATRERLLELA